MSDPNREISGKVVLVTGSNGEIGREFVAAFRAAGAAEVIEVGGRTAGNGMRSLDVTDRSAVEALAAALAGQVDILVNNAGVNGNVGVLSAETDAAAHREMAVNYFGLLNMIRAFTPPMRERRQGVLVNMLTVLSHVNLPLAGSYCASKAAAYSLTQAARAELAPFNVRVCGILPGAVDTRMSAHSPPPKLAPADLARAVITALREGVEDLYPGAVAERMYAALRSDPKTLEKALAARLPQRKLA
jgi:NAD(P)-dependent dehydrogenase (short-subunit alcohol dehydrogenase family)